MNYQGIDPSKKMGLKKLVDYQEGSIVSKEILKKQTGTVTVFAFDKGQGLSPHSAPFDAIVQVLEGTVEIIIGEEKFELSEGTIIIMPADVPHSLKAITKFKMVLTMIK